MTEESNNFICASMMKPPLNTGPSGQGGQSNMGLTFCCEQYTVHATTVLAYAQRGDATCPKCREKMEEIGDLPS